ncbi:MULTISPECIES: hypothetical protein [unclassified Anabaena]|uniref:hypothetical protein n=1 Tax=unclassified Anabaena TaxID=2619674 RepID=UPI000A559FB7|nr:MULTISPECIES: hypothetical protein [unclassified Anabaena]
MGYLLDTNILTAILKKNQSVNNKLEEVRFLGEDDSDLARIQGLNLENWLTTNF